MHTKKILIALAGIIVIVLIAAATGITTGKVPLSGDPASISSGSATITMIADEFSPAVITVKKGTRVTFINRDSLWKWPASDIHPSHDLYPEFDPKRPIAPQDQWSFVFEKTGKWGMHDHLAPYITGKVTVVE